MGKKRNNRSRVRIRQDEETWLKTLSTPFGPVLYLYARSGDSVSSETIGQDYVAFCYLKDKLTFAVCDGVGQSFMGDLAARILGDGLNDWLWDIDRPADAESFSEAVTEALNALTRTSARQVTNYKLPEHLPPIVVQALEMQREYGSESMFVAGRVSLVEPDPWIALCWLGDSPVAAIDINGELVDLGPKGRTSERWNATIGVKGTVHTWVGSAQHVARVAGYTDGLALDHVPTDDDLAKLVELWQSSPPADDASLFDVRLAPSPETTGEEAPRQLPAGDILLRLPAIAGRKPGRGRAPLSESEGGRPIPLPDEAGIDTTPIVVSGPQRTPVAGLEPVKPVAAEDDSTSVSPAVSEWRPLSGKPDKSPQRRPSGAEGMDTEEAAVIATQQQIQMWRQAVIDGLTSARLAMVVIERLLEQLEQQLGGSIRPEDDDVLGHE